MHKHRHRQPNSLPHARTNHRERETNTKHAQSDNEAKNIHRLSTHDTCNKAHEQPHDTFHCPMSVPHLYFLRYWVTFITCSQNCRKPVINQLAFVWFDTVPFFVCQVHPFWVTIVVVRHIVFMNFLGIIKQVCRVCRLKYVYFVLNKPTNVIAFFFKPCCWQISMQISWLCVQVCCGAAHY